MKKKPPTNWPNILLIFGDDDDDDEKSHINKKESLSFLIFVYFMYLFLNSFKIICDGYY